MQAPTYIQLLSELETTLEICAEKFDRDTREAMRRRAMELRSLEAKDIDTEQVVSDLKKLKKEI